MRRWVLSASEVESLVPVGVVVVSRPLSSPPRSMVFGSSTAVGAAMLIEVVVIVDRESLKKNDGLKITRR